jgi:hypothetical protein
MKKHLISLVLTLVCVGACCLYLLIDQNRTDTQPPVISFGEEMLEISTKDPQKLLLQGVTAQDKVDGDVTASLVVESLELLDPDGTIRVTYAAFDKAGNVTKAVRQAKFTDYESPRFSLSQSLTFAYNSGFDIFRMIRAQDALDGDISHRIRVTSLDESSVTTMGLHQVELRVSNSLGETVKLVIPVEVYAAGSYEATLKLKEYLIYLPAGETLDAESYLDVFSRSGNSVALANGLPEGYSLDMKSDVQPDVPGVYTVEYRVTQTAGVGTYTGYAKLIVVVEG